MTSFFSRSRLSILLAFVTLIFIEPANHFLHFLIVHVLLDRNVILQHHLAIVVPIFPETQLFDCVLQLLLLL
jgi:hypothetical protein